MSCAGGTLHESSNTCYAQKASLFEDSRKEFLNEMDDILQAYTLDDTSAVDVAFLMGLRDATDKTAYAQRFLSHIKSVIASPSMFQLLPFLSHLSTLNLSDLPQVTDLSFLERLPALSSLWLFALPRVTDFSFLERLPALSALRLFDLPQVTDFSFLERLPALSNLRLSNLPQVTDLSFLEHLPALSSLELFHLPKVFDFSFLEHLIKLESISIERLAHGSIFPQHVLKRVRITRFT